MAAGTGSGFGRAWTAVFLASVIALAAAQDVPVISIVLPIMGFIFFGLLPIACFGLIFCCLVAKSKRQQQPIIITPTTVPTTGPRFQAYPSSVPAGGTVYPTTAGGTVYPTTAGGTVYPTTAGGAVYPTTAPYPSVPYPAYPPGIPGQVTYPANIPGQAIYPTTQASYPPEPSDPTLTKEAPPSYFAATAYPTAPSPSAPPAPTD